MLDENVIEVRDGFKKYPNSDYILKGINLNVPKGGIYSLLGPSGCGKTTLLSCIVGIQNLSSGFISMPTIRSPHDFGFMPQDIALQTVCTIEETFYMFGLMLGLKKEVTYERYEQLSKLLQLPKGDVQICFLSGGQQRRISFAVALLHNPNTLLLDEPTVGLDPLLRVSIWDYLKESTIKENKTVIITTHYIEEARQSDRIGFMRKGVILKEGRPEILMEAYQCSNLEETFIHLCRENKNTKNNIAHAKEEKVNGPKTTYTFESDYFNYSRFKSMVYKDYLWTKRNIVLLLMLMTLPLSQSFLFCLLFGRYPNNIKLGFYTQESDPSTICKPHHFLRYYDEEFDSMNCTLKQSISCYYLEEIQKKFDVHIYSTVEEGLSSAKKNEVWGLVQVGFNFTEAVITRIIDGRWTDEEIVDESLVNVNIDMSNFILGYHIKYKLIKLLEDTMKHVSKNCFIHEKFAELPLRIEDKFFEDSEEATSASEAVAFIAGFSYYFAIVFTSSALFNEKEQGVINRNKVLGVTMFENVAGHLVIQFFILALQKISMMIMTYGIYEYKIHGSYALIFLGLFLIECVGINLGILFANVFSKGALVMNSAIIFNALALFMFTGSIWPEEGLHWLLKYCKWLIPTQPAISSLRQVIIKNHSLTDSDVYIGYLNCIVWCFLITFMIFIIEKIKKKL